MTPTELNNTRPGGPNRQERTHRAGAPQSPVKAIEETAMLRRHNCVSVHCDQCGTTPGRAEFEAHYPSEAAALDAARRDGWLVGREGRLLCAVCGPILAQCEAEGHQFTAWQRPNAELAGPGGAWCGCGPLGGSHRLGSVDCGREYRYCERCCAFESRTVRVVA